MTRLSLPLLLALLLLLAFHLTSISAEFIFKTRYTIDEYVQFFNDTITRDNLSEYMTLAYTPEQGIHTLAGRKPVDKYRSSIIMVPSYYIVSACKKIEFIINNGFSGWF